MTATKSLIVVMSGPDATAGSMCSLSNMSGIAVPTKPEISIASNRAAPTQPETAKAYPTPVDFVSIIYSPIAAKESMPSKKPFVRLILTSLKMSFMRSLN